MISNLTDQLHGMMVELEERGSRELQNQIYRDNMMDDMFDFMHGMGMPPPPLHYRPHRVQGRGCIQH